MSLLFETGTWTGAGSSPQTITLTNSGLTPIAIMCWTMGTGTAGSFADHAIYSQGFGTRRGGTTQSGCVGYLSTDNVATTVTWRVLGTTLLRLIANSPVDDDYSVSLSSFAAGEFVVTYSSAANANGDIFHYAVWGGTDLTDAIVLNWTMDAITGTEVITGVGFQPDVLFALDNNTTTPDSLDSTYLQFSFGFASSATKFQSVAVTASHGNTATNQMTWNRATYSTNCLARMTIDSNSADALWDVNSFDSDGVSLDVNAPPFITTNIDPFLFIKGGQWEAGSKAKITGTGADTFTLANTTLTPTGVLLMCTRQTSDNAISTGAMDWALGASDGVAQGVVGTTGTETINSNSNRYHSTTRAIAELTGGTTPAATSLATCDTSPFALGTFALNWATNGGSAALIKYLAFGDNAALPARPPRPRPPNVAVHRAASW